MNEKLPHNHGEEKIIRRINEKIPGMEEFDAVSELFKALGDSSRLQIFWILCHTEECVINLAAMLDITSPAVSHHLRNLKLNGLIESRRAGKEVYYKAVDSEKTKMLHIAIETMLEISCPEPEKRGCQQDTDGKEQETSEQEKTARKVHDYLLDNLEKRITIESLSKQFLINQTTLKDSFKAVYGCSIAAHIKEHRMEKAAELLTVTSKSIAEVAKEVGYASQSKFSSAFYEYYHSSPLEYRKNRRRAK